MKKLSVILFVLCVSGSLQAQQGVRLGLSGGLLFSRAATLDSIPRHFTLRMKSGFSGGINMHIGFTDRVGLTTGLSYTQKGYRLYNDTNKHGNVIRSTVGNLELPVALNLRQGLNSSSFIRENIGIAMNFSLNNRDTIRSENDNASFRIKQIQSGKIYPMLFLGFEFGSETATGNMFMFGVHYKQALALNSTLNIYNTQNTASPKLFDLGYRGSYVSIQFTYLFNFSSLKKREEFFD